MAELIRGLGGPAGFGENEGPSFDDDSTGPIDLTRVFPGGLNVFGVRLDEVWINSNGNLTFDGPFWEYFPNDIDTLGTAGLYPFWSDVDVSLPAAGISPGGASQGTNAIWYDLDPQGGTFTVTWDDVRPYNAGFDDFFFEDEFSDEEFFDDEFSDDEFFDEEFFDNGDAVNAFQIRLTDISDEPGRLPGDLEVELRYEAIEWTSGIGGPNEALGRIGFTIGDGESFFELDASGRDAALRELPDLGPIRFTFDDFGIRGDGASPVIRGTDGDDLLLGTEGADAIISGMGRDTIQPGLGDDEIILRGGSKVVAGTAQELFGDVLLGAVWDDALLFTDAAFDAEAISLSEDGRTISFDLDGDGVADGSVLSEVAIRGGAFLTAQSDAGTFVGYVRDLPELAQGSPVEGAARLTGDGLTGAYLSGDGAAAFEVTIDAALPPAPGTVLGTYEVTAEGDIVDARILTRDAGAAAGESFILDSVEAANELGFFLLRPDDPDALSADTLAFVDQTAAPANVDDRSYVFAVQDGAVVAGDLFHSYDPSLNQDLTQHVLVAREAGTPGLTLAFEDAMFGGSADFADLVLSVERIAADIL